MQWQCDDNLSVIVSNVIKITRRNFHEERIFLREVIIIFGSNELHDEDTCMNTIKLTVFTPFCGQLKCKQLAYQSETP